MNVILAVSSQMTPNLIGVLYPRPYINGMRHQTYPTRFPDNKRPPYDSPMDPHCFQNVGDLSYVFSQNNMFNKIACASRLKAARFYRDT